MKLFNWMQFWCLTLLAIGLAPSALAQKGMDQININGQFVLAARAGQVERVRDLLTQGAIVNSRDRNGDSPLNMAAAKGHVALVEVLLKSGADVNLANLSGVTPLMSAVFAGHAGIVRTFLDSGAKVEPLDRVKKNAAVYAAATGCDDCLMALLSHGTQVNSRLENDLTLLMWGAGYGQEAVVRILLSAGADRTLKDNRGKTAADMAREGNHQAVLNLLM